jgi:hypothetical protein
MVFCAWVVGVASLAMVSSAVPMECGDGILDVGEACDPPDATPIPGTFPEQPRCRPDCTFCGDGILEAGDGEVCDAGTAVCGPCNDSCLFRIVDGGGSFCPCGINDPAMGDLRADIAAACPCAGAASHHEFVRCARAKLQEEVAVGRVLPGCVKAVAKCAAKSICGRAGAVTCCRTSPRGVQKCLIKRDTAHCTAPAGGTAQLGATDTCCDACP